jgi:hypothetical protein
MQILLDVPNQRDWLSLMPLLERLGIHFAVQADDTDAQSLAQSERDWEIIMHGIKIDNMDEFMRGFDESRKDRPMPFRD